MTVSSYPVSTADHVLPPYANSNEISALSTGTFSANNYSQAYVGGSRRRRGRGRSKKCKKCMKKRKSMRKLVKTRSAKKLYYKH